MKIITEDKVQELKKQARILSVDGNNVKPFTGRKVPGIPGKKEPATPSPPQPDDNKLLSDAITLALSAANLSSETAQKIQEALSKTLERPIQVTVAMPPKDTKPKELDARIVKRDSSGFAEHWKLTWR